jgi:hypothetical protein
MQSRGEQRGGRLVVVVSREDEVPFDEAEQADDTEIELPGKHEVCARCEGFGTHLNPSIGEHAFTAEEFNESFHEDEDREQYFKRGGIYDVPCEQCGGAKVLIVVDEARCTSEQLATLEQVRQDENARAREEAEDRQTMRRESGEW